MVGKIKWEDNLAWKRSQTNVSAGARCHIGDGGGGGAVVRQEEEPWVTLATMQIKGLT